MQPLDDRQVLEVLGRWANVLEHKKGLWLDAVKMQRGLMRDRGLARLSGNALLLTLAVLFYKPRRRLGGKLCLSGLGSLTPFCGNVSSEGLSGLSTEKERAKVRARGLRKGAASSA